MERFCQVNLGINDVKFRKGRICIYFENFFRLTALFDLVLTVVNILSWNLLSALVPFDKRHKYEFPNNNLAHISLRNLEQFIYQRTKELIVITDPLIGNKKLLTLLP